MKYRKTNIRGRCPVSRCRNAPRNLRDHPQSAQLCGSHAKELWRIRNPVQAAYDTLRTHARARRKEFTITLAEFRSLVEPTRYLDDKGNERHSLHIDRIDATLGYTTGNLQVLTCTENVVKGNAERRQQFVDEKIRGRVADDPEGDPF